MRLMLGGLDFGGFRTPQKFLLFLFIFWVGDFNDDGSLARESHGGWGT